MATIQIPVRDFNKSKSLTVWSDSSGVHFMVTADKYSEQATVHLVLKEDEFRQIARWWL